MGIADRRGDQFPDREARIAKDVIFRSRGVDRVAAFAAGDPIDPRAAGDRVAVGAADDDDRAGGAGRVDRVVAVIGERIGVAGDRAGRRIVFDAAPRLGAVKRQRIAARRDVDGVGAAAAFDDRQGLQAVDRVEGGRGGVDGEGVVALAEEDLDRVKIDVADPALVGRGDPGARIGESDRLIAGGKIQAADVVALAAGVFAECDRRAEEVARRNGCQFAGLARGRAVVIDLQHVDRAGASPVALRRRLGDRDIVRFIGKRDGGSQRRLPELRPTVDDQRPIDLRERVRLIREGHVRRRRAALPAAARSLVIGIGRKRDRNRDVPVGCGEGVGLIGRVESRRAARGDGLPVAQEIDGHGGGWLGREHHLIGVGLAAGRDAGRALGLENEHSGRVGRRHREVHVAGVDAADRLLDVDGLLGMRTGQRRRNGDRLWLVPVRRIEGDARLRKLNSGWQGAAVGAGQVDGHRLSGDRLLVERQVVAVGGLTRHDRRRGEALVDDEAGGARLQRDLNRRQNEAVERLVGSRRAADGDDRGGDDDRLVSRIRVVRRDRRGAHIDCLRRRRAGEGERQV